MTKADLLNHYFTYYKNISEINSDIDKYLGVDKIKLQKTAEKYLQKENRSVLTFLPKK